MATKKAVAKKAAKTMTAASTTLRGLFDVNPPPYNVIPVGTVPVEVRDGSGSMFTVRKLSAAATAAASAPTPIAELFDVNPPPKNKPITFKSWSGKSVVAVDEAGVVFRISKKP